MVYSSATIIFFLFGVASVSQDQCVVSASKSTESNIATSDFDRLSSFARHDRERNHSKRDTTQQHIATRIVGGFNGVGRTPKRQGGSLGMVALSRQIMRNSISRTTQPPQIISKRVSKSNPYGYRSNRSQSQINVSFLALKEHYGVSNLYSSSKQDQFHSSNRPKLQTISSPSRMVTRDRRTRLKLSSSIAASASRSSFPTYLRNKISISVPPINKQDLAIVIAYVCTQLAITIPVILLPMIAADPFLPTSAAHLSPRLEGAAFVGAIVSLSTLGAAIGKFANGFVCKSIGGRMAGSFYLLGLSAFSLLLSSTTSLHGIAIAGMEFCASIMWTACSVIIANRYERDPKKFSAAIMTLSLGSTGGILLAKTLGTALLCNYHWRQVARFSSIMALIGSMIMFWLVEDVAREKRMRSILWTKGGSQNNASGLNAIFDSAFRVLSNRAFWMVGFGHATAYLARSSDKLLGAFVRDVTGLPIYLCGSLTSSVTIGFVIGLISGRKIDSLESPGERRMFTSRRYRRAAFSAMGLALCANRAFGAFLGNTFLAVAITVASGIMASSVAYQFYQFPTAFGKSFDDDRAVCISFLDGIACLVASPIWSIVSRLVASARLGSHGWSLAWLVIASLFGIGGNIMMRTLSSVIPSVGKER